MVELKNAAGIVIGVVIFAIILGIGGTILGDIEQIQCEDSFTCGANASGSSSWASANNTCICLNHDGDAGLAEAGSYAVNATGSGLEGVGTMSDWIPTIAVIIVSALVIGIIGAYFYMRR